MNIGLSDETGDIPAKVDNLNFGGARLTSEDNANEKFSLVALDEYLLSAAPKPISFIKMAAGGYELKALEGASDTLQRHQALTGKVLMPKDEPALD